MAVTRHEIDTYRLYINNGEVDQIAVIHCYKGHVFKGSLLFHKEGNAVPSGIIHQNQSIFLHFHENQLPILLDVLRNESPLFIWVEDRNFAGGLATTPEPVGEGEV